MKIQPTNNYILCENIQDDIETVEEHHIVYKKDKVKLYKVISDSVENRYKKDDIILCNSIGTPIVQSDRKQKSDCFLFNVDNVIGKIERL